MIKKYHSGKQLKSSRFFKILILFNLLNFLLSISLNAFGVSSTVKPNENTGNPGIQTIISRKINGKIFAGVFSARLQELITQGTEGMDFLDELNESEGFNPEKITYNDHFDICSAFKVFRESMRKFMFELEIVNKLSDPTRRHEHQFTDFFFGQNFILDYLVPISTRNTFSETFCNLPVEVFSLDDWLLPELKPTNFKGFMENQETLLSQLNEMMSKIGDPGQYSEEFITIFLDEQTLDAIRDYVTPPYESPPPLPESLKNAIKENP